MLKLPLLLANWPFPRSISELRGFFWDNGYFRIFIPRYTAIADPLTECLRKAVQLACTPERQRAFDELKKMLVSPPVASDDPDCTYVLNCDANANSAAACLQQWQGGMLRVIEYASRTFSSQERR